MNKRISELTREREILNRNYIQSLNNNAKQNSIIKVNEQTIKNTEHEIQSYRDEASKMRKVITNLNILYSYSFNFYFFIYIYILKYYFLI